jgi:hypothetical protein
VEDIQGLLRPLGRPVDLPGEPPLVNAGVLLKPRSSRNRPAGRGRTAIAILTRCSFRITFSKEIDMRNSKLVFAFAMAMALGTGALAWTRMDPNESLSDDQAAMVFGAGTITNAPGCSISAQDLCTQFGQFCNATQGFNTTSPFGTLGTLSDPQSCAQDVEIGACSNSINVTRNPCAG